MARTNNGVAYVLKYPKHDSSAIKGIFCFASTQFYYYEKKLSIPTKFWNKNTMRVKETKSFPVYSEINSTLNAIETVILDCYRRFKNDNNREPSIEELRLQVKLKRGSFQQPKQIELIEFINHFILEAEEKKHINLATGKPVTVVTIRTYKQTLKLLNAYIAKKNIVLRFNDINPVFHRQFVHFLMQEYISNETAKHLSVNTTGKHITNIKTFMNVAFERKLTSNEDYKMKSFKVLHEKVDNIYLDKEEIKMLQEFDLTASGKTQQRVRDIIVLGCYTGLRISDLKRLTNEHLEEDEDGQLSIKIEMRKTEEPVYVWIEENAKKILDQYKEETGCYFPKPISEQKLNLYIKEICSKIDIFKREVNITSTENNLRITKRLPKYSLITTHTMRRSYATNAVIMGIPYSVIMPMTGHKTEKSFLRYVKLEGRDSIKVYKAFKDRIQLKAV